MRLPFSDQQFLDVFRLYNESVWPAQWVLASAALAALWLALRPGRGPARAVSAILAGLWLWAGLAYHVVFFTLINGAALGFGVLFVVQAALFAWLALRGTLVFHPRRDAAGVAGGALVAYALVIYPLIGYALGHRFPEAPTFGLPCPTTIFTFGLLLWARPTVPRIALVIPSVWAIIGTSAAVRLGMTEDLGLGAAMLLALTLFISPHANVRGARLATR